MDKPKTTEELMKMLESSVFRSEQDTESAAWCQKLSALVQAQCAQGQVAAVVMLSAKVEELTDKITQQGNAVSTELQVWLPGIRQALEYMADAGIFKKVKTP